MPLLALMAAGVHLIRYFQASAPPPSRPAGGSPSGPPSGAPPPSSGVVGLIGPHLAQAFFLNFVAFVVLAILFVALRRAPVAVRIAIDALLALLCLGTLYAWNALDRKSTRLNSSHSSI